MDIHTTVTLNNHIKIPQLGLGVYKSLEGEEAYNAVRWALEAGYRHIDTAALYGNETSVGQALRDCGIPREEIFVTTKIWNTSMRDNRQDEAFKESLDKLGCGYIDLYLVHWPVADKYAETWTKLEKIYKTGIIRAIGVSNFNRHHIETLMETAEITPAVNQIELHPLLSQPELTAYCRGKGIAVTAWSPLGQGNLLTHPVIMSVAKSHNVGEAQIILRWHLQHGNIVIPKSIHRDRILRNADLYGFELAAEEMSRIDSLNKNSRFGADPETFDF